LPWAAQRYWAPERWEAGRPVRGRFRPRGDIYVAEVSRTYWLILFGQKPDHELRSFQKLVRVG